MKRETTNRQIKAAIELYAKGAKSTGKALLAAGYEPSVAKNPKQQNLTARRLFEVYQEVTQDDESLESLARLGKRRLREILEDPTTPPSTAGSLAGAVVKLHQESPDDEQESKRRSRRLARGTVQSQRLLRLGILLGLQSPTRAKRWLEQIEAELHNPERLHDLAAPRQTPKLLVRRRDG